MAEAQTLEPTADSDGFTPEERAQFVEMQQADTPEPAAPEVPETPAAPVSAPATPDAPEVKPPVAGAAITEEDDGEDEPAPAVKLGEVVDPNAQKPRRVNFAKFQRMEARAKAAETALREKETNNARLDERLKLINEALATPKQTAAEEDPEPDPEKDIFGHNAWLKRQFTKQQAQLEEIRSGRQAETEDTQIATTYTTDAEQFARSEPNFIPAYQHLMGVRLSQLAMYYYGKDVTDADAAPLSANEINHIRTIAAAEEKQVVAEALKAGQRPAQRIYQLAKASGYKPQAAAAPQPQNGGAPPAPAAQNGHANGNGAAPAKPSVTDEIAKIKAGQEASLSLSGGGGSPANPLTAERLANMPQDQFDRLLDSMDPSEIRAIMGG